MLSGALASLIDPIRALIQQSKFDVSIIPTLLAQKVPAASSYFLSSIPLQGFSSSAAGLLRVDSLLVWSIAITFGGKIARKKFNRRINMPATNKWGTQFPQFTTFACITIIYSVAAPLLLPLASVGFFAWWVSTRYQVLFVYRYRVDTGGRMYPEAIKQLFTGIYVLELFLVGFTTTVLADDSVPEKGTLIPLPIIMGTVFFFTIVFHWMLKRNFDPLLEYLPITLEDGAAKKDEEYARLLEEPHDDLDEIMSGVAQGDVPARLASEKPSPETFAMLRRSTFHHLPSHVNGGHETSHDDEAPRRVSDPDLHTAPPTQPGKTSLEEPLHETREVDFAKDDKKLHKEPSQGSLILTERPTNGVDTIEKAKDDSASIDGARGANPNVVLNWVGQQLHKPVDFVIPTEEAAAAVVSARDKEAAQLYGNIPADLEDLSPEARDALVNNAYLHSALRAKRPCIWIPRDLLGVSDDEISNTKQFTQWIWINNERNKMRLVEKKSKVLNTFQGPPPDFDEVDLIQL
jgi:hypothetical protein